MIKQDFAEKLKEKIAGNPNDTTGKDGKPKKKNKVKWDRVQEYSAEVLKLDSPAVLLTWKCEQITDAVHVSADHNKERTY